jgi:hypothetical protein
MFGINEPAAVGNLKQPVLPYHQRRILIDGLSFVCQEKLTHGIGR